MYYVTKLGSGILNFHARFNDEAPARNYAENLKASYGHEYEVIKVVTTWTPKNTTQQDA